MARRSSTAGTSRAISGIGTSAAAIARRCAGGVLGASEMLTPRRIVAGGHETRDFPCYAGGVRAKDVLGPGSPLAGLLDAYEDRPAQLAMAAAVEDALSAEQPLLVEAGTGTGKTLAYLVPAVLSG